MLPKFLTINNPKSISHICLLVQIMEANIPPKKTQGKLQQKCISNPVKHQTWSFLQKPLTAFRH